MLSQRVSAPSLAAVAAALTLQACGSAPPSELPPPAAAVTSPRLDEMPAGRVEPLDPRYGAMLARTAGSAVAGGRTYRVDSHTDTLTAVEDGRVVARARTGLEPGVVVVMEDGRRVAVLTRRGRAVEIYDARTLERQARVPAGIGPVSMVAGGDDRLYVVDTLGNALLVFRLDPEPRLDRRYHIEGHPWGLAADRERGELFVTVLDTNEVVRLRGGYRPGALERYPAVRQPERIAVDGRGRVRVIGRGGDVLQTFSP